MNDFKNHTLIGDLRKLYLSTKNKQIESLFLVATDSMDRSFIEWLSNQNSSKLKLKNPDVLNTLKCLDRVKNANPSINYTSVSQYFLKNTSELAYYPMIEVFQKLRNRGHINEILNPYQAILAIAENMQVSDASHQSLSNLISEQSVLEDLETIINIYNKSHNIDLIEGDVPHSKPKKLNKKEKVKFLLSAVIRRFVHEFSLFKDHIPHGLEQYIDSGNIANALFTAQTLHNIGELPHPDLIDRMTSDAKKVAQLILQSIDSKSQDEIYNWIRSRGLNFAGTMSDSQYSSYMMQNLSKQDLGGYIQKSEPQEWEVYNTHPSNIFQNKYLMYVSIVLYTLHKMAE